jgi:HK97 family phage major capsid protein
MPDSASAKSLREKRCKIIADARKIIDKCEAEGRSDMTAEEQQQYQRIMGTGETIPAQKDASGNIIKPESVDHGEEGRLKKRIEEAERLEAVEGDLSKPINALGGTPAGGDGGSANDTGSRRGKRARKEAEQRRQMLHVAAFQAWAGFNHFNRTKDDLPQQLLDAVSELEKMENRKINFRQQSIGVRLTNSDRYSSARNDYRNGREFRAGNANPQGLVPNTAGGYTVPEGFVNNLEIALLQYGGIRQVADVMRTTSGQDLPWPNVNDTTVKGVRINENVTVATKDMTFGAIVFHAYKYTSGIVLVPAELMEDTAFNMAALLGELLGIRIGRILSDEFTVTGAGAAPSGIVTAATAGITAASATAVAGDDIYGLKHSVDPAYRTGPGVGFMFHDKILLAIKKLKDGFGRYLWQASLAGGAPDTLDGDPITINQSMASTIASGAITMLYGKLNKYKIRDVSEVRLRRLVERFADADQEAFLMFSRHDGQLIDAGTHPVKVLTH